MCTDSNSKEHVDCVRTRSLQSPVGLCVLLLPVEDIHLISTCMRGPRTEI